MVTKNRLKRKKMNISKNNQVSPDSVPRSKSKSKGESDYSTSQVGVRSAMTSQQFDNNDQSKFESSKSTEMIPVEKVPSMAFEGKNDWEESLPKDKGPSHKFLTFLNHKMNEVLPDIESNIQELVIIE